MPNYRRIAVLIVICLLCPLSASTQTVEGTAKLREGLVLFKQGQYRQSILSFRDIIFNPRWGSLKPDAYFWISKSYMAIEMLEDAERNLEYYLNNYSNHPYHGEAVYLKGRLLFLQQEFEKSVQVLQGFISQFPTSEYIPNAYHWSGEALYVLGQLNEAARVFKKVVQEYPKSYKVEASRYLLSIIEFKKRENELLKLLKWSHEESLKTVEEFQRREKAYEQAVDAYQRRISEFRQGEPEIARENESLSQELESLKQKVKLLEQQIAVQSAGANAQDSQDLENTLKLLQLKQESLDLKEQLLGILESGEP